MDKCKSQYDEIADKYDDLFTDCSSLAENTEVGEMLLPLSGSVLDIGCGTGLLTEILTINPKDYCGIDPSEKMLLKFKQKHPEYTHLICDKYDGLCIDCNQYDNIIALFGSASYLDEQSLITLALSRKRKFLMFYKDEYYPVTYLKCNVDFIHNKHSLKELSELFNQNKVDEYRNYIIIR